jgi:head-tail adaptor
MARGNYRHRVRVESLGRAPDGEGGYYETWTPAGLEWWVSLEPAGARDVEYETAGTVAATATHIVEGDFRPDVTVESRLSLHDFARNLDRVFQVTNVRDLDERHITLRLLTEEQL